MNFDALGIKFTGHVRVKEAEALTTREGKVWAHRVTGQALGQTFELRWPDAQLPKPDQFVRIDGRIIPGAQRGQIVTQVEAWEAVGEPKLSLLALTFKGACVVTASQDRVAKKSGRIWRREVKGGLGDWAVELCWPDGNYPGDGQLITFNGSFIPSWREAGELDLAVEKWEEMKATKAA